MSLGSFRVHLVSAVVGFFALGIGCSSKQHITQVGNAKYRIHCKTSLADCLGQVELVCQSGFEVLSASDERHTYGITHGSDDTKTEVRTSKAMIRCRSSKPLFGGDDDEDRKHRLVRKSTESTAPSRACVPGSTQACVGRGACTGGQMCLLDGSAFGPCECSAEDAPTSAVDPANTAVTPVVPTPTAPTPPEATGSIEPTPPPAPSAN